MGEHEILEKYSFFPITEEAQGKIQALRVAFSEIESVVLSVAPDSRLRSVALTDLESAAMFAIKSIAHAPANRK